MFLLIFYGRIFPMFRSSRSSSKSVFYDFLIIGFFLFLNKVARSASADYSFKLFLVALVSDLNQKLFIHFMWLFPCTIYHTISTCVGVRNIWAFLWFGRTSHRLCYTALLIVVYLCFCYTASDSLQYWTKLWGAVLIVQHLWPLYSISRVATTSSS